MNNFSESTVSPNENKLNFAGLKQDLLLYRKARKKFLDQFSYHEVSGIIYFNDVPVAEITAENHRTKVWVGWNEKYRGEGKTLTEVYESIAAWMIFTADKENK